MVRLRTGTSKIMCLHELLKEAKEGLLQILTGISLHIEGAA